MEYQTVLSETDGGVATITMNRPQVLNSCNRRMVAELRDVFVGAGTDAAVRAVVLTGAGRAFCAGQDLGEAVPSNGSPAPDLGAIVADYNALVLAIRGLEKPVIAAVNGAAAGAGANIALACDLVIAGENASFIQAFIKIGLIPDNGGTFFLPRLVGMARATALMMLGERVSAQQAFDWGLIYQVVSPGLVLETARELARHLASQPTRGLGLIKRALNASARNDLEAQLALEAELQREAGRSADYQEGVQAFKDKRSPTFLGR
jgi:2-(1,2-epoxy-1,2-dihydrophenyl)acetyl-CoA isomerase